MLPSTVKGEEGPEVRHRNIATQEPHLSVSKCNVEAVSVQALAN